MDLSQFTVEELQKMQQGDFSGISTEKLQSLQQGLATAGVPGSQPASTFTSLTAPQPVEPQRMRMMAQGASLGTSDELEAAVRSMFPGQEYQPVLQQIRDEIKAYRKDQPGASLAYELGGAAMVPGFGLKKLVGESPTLARLVAGTAGYGAAAGGVTAAATGEGDVWQRLSRVPGGAAMGAVAGPAGYAIGKGIQGAGNAFVDFARRRLGGRGAKIVETELQRIAKQMDLSTDEIADKILRGEIMAENATIQDIVRAYGRGGGEAQSIIREALTTRPGQLRDDAIQQLSKYLAPDMPGNVRQQMAMSDAAAKRAEKQAYGGAFEQGAVINKDMLDALTEGVKRAPQAGAALQDAYRAQTGKSPFFRFQDGEIVFDRAPTLQDFEIVRRGLRDLQDQAYRAGAGASGEGYKEAELMLRDAIDAASPALASARTGAKETRTARDAFKLGQSIFSQNADQVVMDFNKMSNNPASVRALRAGVMDALRAKMATGNKLTTVSRLADETTKEGQILRTVFPGDQLDSVIGSLGRATQSARAAGAVLGGSSTAPTQMAAQRIGSDLSAQEIANAATGNIFALGGIARKLVDRLAPKNLSDAQRAKVAEILVSTDPKMVSNALQDQSGLAMLQAQIQRITSRLPGMLLSAGTVGGGLAGANMTGAQ